MIAKGNDTRHSYKCTHTQIEIYILIMWLPMLYKIFTSTIDTKIYRHLEKSNLLTEQQKGCKRKSQGCMERSSDTGCSVFTVSTKTV
jgi:hypothetical protein